MVAPGCPGCGSGSFVNEMGHLNGPLKPTVIQKRVKSSLAPGLHRKV